jgi:hypothetical protein
MLASVISSSHGSLFARERNLQIEDVWSASGVINFSPKSLANGA